MKPPSRGELTEHALKKYRDLGLDEGLERIARKTQAFETSHIIVTYPSYQALAPMDEDDIDPGDADLSLYLHIPFCVNKCAYCHYVSGVGGEAERRRYLRLLEKEVDLTDEKFGLRSRRVRSIHVGGGTPTVMGTCDLIRLLDKVNGVFDVRAGAEVTIESCPKTLLERIQEDGFSDIQDHGANRISVGVQSFNDRILDIANREHTGEEAAAAVQAAREAGFGNINIDLMNGLPAQTLETLYEDLESTAELAPESVTTYHLRLKSHVPMHDLLMRHSGYFPSPKTSLLMDLMTRECLRTMGYDEDPINWFNKRPRYAYRHQIQKWKHQTDLLAFGVSAYSYLNRTQYYNRLGLLDYAKDIRKGRLPIYVGRRLPPGEQRRRTAIFALKTKDGVDKKAYALRYGREFADEHRKKTSWLKKLGLLEETSAKVRLTEKGRLFADEIARQFYSPQVNKTAAAAGS